MLEAIEHRLEAIEHRLEAIEHRLEAVEHRPKMLEHMLQALEHMLETLHRGGNPCLPMLFRRFCLLPSIGAQILQQHQTFGLRLLVLS